MSRAGRAMNIDETLEAAMADFLLMTTANDIIEALEELSDPERAGHLQRYFEIGNRDYCTAYDFLVIHCQR